MLIAFFTALAATVVAQAAPGPNLLAVATVALSQGRRPAVMVALGVATGVWFWVTACIFGVSAFFARYPASGELLGFAGGVYFLILAIRVLLNSTSGKRDPLIPVKQPISLSAAYQRGLMVVLTNPKAVMMWIAITAFLFGSGLQAPQVFWIAPAGSLSALLIYGCCGFLFSTATARAIYGRFSRAFELTFGLVFGFPGLRLIYDGYRGLVSSMGDAPQSL